MAAQGPGLAPPPRTLPPGPQSPVGRVGGGDPTAPAPPASHRLSCPEPGRQEVSEPGRGGGGRGRKLGVTLPETPDGAPAWERGRRVRRDSGCPSSSCRPCDPGRSAPLGQGEGRCLWRPPAACTGREGLPLSTLPQRRPPTTPPPRAPPGPAQPGFSIRPGSARQLSGDRADLREQGVSISRRSDKRAGPSLRAPRGRSPAPATPRQTRSRWEQR